MVENPPHIPPHRQPMHRSPDRPKRQLVPHNVPHPRPATLRLKLMRMVPQPIRPPNLRIHKSHRRRPFLDSSHPADRQPMPAQSILNQRTSPHLNRPRCHNRKAEPIRSNRIQVPRVGEKREYLGQRPRNHLLANNDVSRHVGSLARSTVESAPSQSPRQVEDPSRLIGALARTKSKQTIHSPEARHPIRRQCANPTPRYAPIRKADSAEQPRRSASFAHQRRAPARLRQRPSDPARLHGSGSYGPGTVVECAGRAHFFSRITAR